MGRVCYVPSLLWAEFVMCRVDPTPYIISICRDPTKVDLQFGTKSFRHLDDSALDVSAPTLKKIPGRFGTKTSRHQGVSVPRYFGTRSIGR